MKRQFLLDITNPILRAHSVFGAHVFPGLAYIDLLYRLLSAYGYVFSLMELRNLAIHRPLIVTPECGVVLDIECRKRATDVWAVEITGTDLRNGRLARVVQRYATAEILRCEAANFDARLDLPTILAGSARRDNLGEIYAQCRQVNLVHDALMRADGERWVDGESLYVDCRLGPEAGDQSDCLMFHPALIDGSAIGAMGALHPAAVVCDTLSLPIFFESFRASELMQKRCIARLSFTGIRQRGKLTYGSFEFFNEAGTMIAKLTNVATVETTPATWNKTPNAGASPSHGETTIAAPRMMVCESQSEVKGRNVLELNLKRLISQHTGLAVDRIDADAGYFDLGLSSATLLAIASELEAQTGLKVSPLLLFEYGSVHELAGYLAACIESSPATVADAHRLGDHESTNSDVVPAVRVPSVVLPPPRDRAQPIAELPREDIAVIAVAGHFPQADSLEDLSECLREGRDCITDVPPGRWNAVAEWAVPGRVTNAKSVNLGGFLQSVAEFDSLFFNISPSEAEVMDPQERLFLQVTWSLLEGAGCTRQVLRDRYSRRVGVYVGSMYAQYALLASDPLQDAAASMAMHSSIANRVSSWFGLCGPSMAVDTMCSSSMVGIHLACSALHSGECALAIAGGVNLSVHPKKYTSLGLMQLLGSHSGSRSFADGDGYIPAEAVGAVLLKRLSEAQADGDRILAIIKSTAVNHNGRSAGYRVPSVRAQMDVIRECLGKAGIAPETISYVEAAANGSPLGDAIELEALGKVFGESRQPGQWCALGSVKANLGHAEAASGVCQLAKVILQLQCGELFPTLLAGRLNPNIDFESTPFRLQRKLQAWMRPKLAIEGQMCEVPRRALVNSFGAGGTNATLLLEEYIQPRRRPEPARVAADATQVYVFSARSSERLRQVLMQMQMHFIRHPAISSEEVAYTLQLHREAMDSRMAFVADDMNDLRRKIDAFLTASPASEEASRQRGDEPSKIKMLFAGAAGATFGEALVAAKDCERLALFWMQGGEVPWKTFYANRVVAPIWLPTYPFKPERHWLTDRPKGSPDEIVEELESVATAEDITKQNLTQLVAVILKLPVNSIPTDADLSEYGMESIARMRLIRQLEARFQVVINTREIVRHSTIDDLVALVAAKREESVSSVRSSGNVVPLVLAAQARPAVLAHDGNHVERMLQDFKQGRMDAQAIEKLIADGYIA